MIGKIFIKMMKSIKRNYKLYEEMLILNYNKKDFFKIVRKIGKLIYKIDFPEYIKIHSIILIIYLKQISNNLYNY